MRYFVLSKIVAREARDPIEKKYIGVMQNEPGEKFMGFHPTLSPDTFILLQRKQVLPIKFIDNKIELDPMRTVIKSQHSPWIIWAACEIEFDTLALAF